MTFEKHQKIGAQLQEIEHFIGDLETDVSIEYGKSCDAAKAASAIYKKLGFLRSEMENFCYRTYPGESNIDVYWPLFTGQVGRWVSVAESMPDDCMDCLVWSAELNAPTIAYHDSDFLRWEGCGWLEIGTGAMIQGVTHWCQNIQPPDLSACADKSNRVESGN